jgi:hypothetical protein
MRTLTLFRRANASPCRTQFVDDCQSRVGTAGFVPNAPLATCECGATMQGNEANHATSCKHIGTSCLHCRHDVLTAALLNATSRAGLSSTREPLYAQLDRNNAATVAARGDIYNILIPGLGPTAVNNVITHPGTATTLPHHTVQGPAAAWQRKVSASVPTVSRGFPFLH